MRLGVSGLGANILDAVNWWFAPQTQSLQLIGATNAKKQADTYIEAPRFVWRFSDSQFGQAEVGAESMVTHANGTA